MKTLTISLVVCLGLGAATNAWADPPSAQAVAARIDRHLEAAWTTAQIKPAAPADDFEFLRRVSLDLIGRIPSAQEVYAFAADSESERRGRALDRLLASPGTARHWATVWRRTMLPQAGTPQQRVLGPGFEAWLQQQLQNDVPYDRMVSAILTPAPGRSEGGSAGNFLIAAQGKPETLAANSARAFLGLNLDCAECHDHPFSRWTKQEFWDYAAFFAAPSRKNPTMPVLFELKIPETEKVAKARLLNGTKPSWPAKLEADSGRKVLAQWTVSKDNPYFARNAVNRVWAQLFGVGIVEPLDDLTDNNPPSNPEVLDELTRTFIESGFNLKHVVRVITATKAYQLSSIWPADRPTPDPRLFARMPVRGLSGEQMYDSLRLAAGLPLDPADPEQTSVIVQRLRFLAQFQDDRPSKAQRTILQALELMNGPITETATRSKTVAAVADAPFLNASGKVEALFMTVLSRRPSDAEAKTWLADLDTQDPDARRQALADLFWVLVNSTEFSVNH